jgi:hypothetical protein
VTLEDAVKDDSGIKKQREFLQGLRESGEEGVLIPAFIRSK